MPGTKMDHVVRGGVMVVALLVLSACRSSDDGTVATSVSESTSRIIFSYPVDGQRAVPTGADLILSFDKPVDPSLYRILDLAGHEVATDTTLAGEGRILRLNPLPELAAGMEYYVVYGAKAESQQNLLHFETQGAGARTGASLALVSELPHSDAFPFTTFSTLRLQFNKPLDPKSAASGNGFKMLDPRGNQVEGNLKVSGDKLVFDPHDDLIADAHYEVVLTTDLMSSDGKHLPAETSFTVQPLSVGGIIPHRMTLTPSSYDESGITSISDVVGQELNTMKLESRLIGTDQLAVAGSIEVGVGDPRNFSRLIPFTIRKGQQFYAESLAVMLGGEIESGLNSGRLSIELLTDANGFFMDNSYGEDGPVTTAIFMDIGVSASNSLEQGVINTEALQVQATGLLTIGDRKLHAEVYGVLEIELLGGADKATATFALKMSGPEEIVSLDSEALGLEVVSTYPRDGTSYIAVDDDILVNFSQAIDPSSVRTGSTGNLRFIDGAGRDVDFDLIVRGATLLIDPVEPLQYGGFYRVIVDAGISSLAGRAFESTHSIEWKMASHDKYGSRLTSTSTHWPPQLISIRPGVPCALAEGDWQTGGSKAGYCRNGARDGEPGYNGNPATAETNFDVFLARGRNVVEAHFSQAIDPATLVRSRTCENSNDLADTPTDSNVTIRIERVDQSGFCESVVPGRIRVSERSFTFVPDSSWEVGQLYKITLESSKIVGAFNGLALNTDSLVEPRNRSGAGSNVIIPFLGAKPDDSIYLPLAAHPYADVNGDGQITTVEADVNNPPMVGYASSLIEVTSTEGPVVDARIVKPLALESSKGYMYLNYILINEIERLDFDQDRGIHLPVRITPQFLHGTSITIEADYGIPLVAINAVAQTNQIVIRPAVGPEGFVKGYITANPVKNEGGAIFTVEMPLYIDAPEMELQAVIDTGINPRDLLRSKRVTLLLQGPVYNLPDGRIALHLENQNAGKIRVKIEPIVAGITLPAGYINLELPINGVKLDLIGPPLKGFNKILGVQ